LKSGKDIVCSGHLTRTLIYADSYSIVSERPELFSMYNKCKLVNWHYLTCIICWSLAMLKIIV